MQKKILCVEDNSTMRLLVESILKNDYLVQTAEDGREGLLRAKTFKPDLIILDILLPDMSGYEVCSFLQGEDELKNIPIIMLSSNKDVQSKITSYKLGAINYVEKPFDKNEFRAIVSSVLAKSETRGHVLKYGDMTLNLDSQIVMIQTSKVDLTPSEFRLLVAVIKERGAIVERAQLNKLFNESDSEGVDRVVNYHMSLLRKKVKSSNVAIKSVYGKGYRAELA
ncbi:response regulator transcription factor [Halobacteriovorax sp. GB3]|uniref:response regulator transcription factor n=1 Tax=Halobacteriovorax sp. GB3 TaxID=2719615 RepID=UPI00235EB242|nr:response regulator transcription factor [Halobacteriovorax sp. GB3]MDD0853269.1 response regulator transcription factor [Halobacteriovorax sp. GB3]